MKNAPRRRILCDDAKPQQVEINSNTRSNILCDNANVKRRRRSVGLKDAFKYTNTIDEKGNKYQKADLKCMDCLKQNGYHFPITKNVDTIFFLARFFLVSYRHILCENADTIFLLHDFLSTRGKGGVNTILNLLHDFCFVIDFRCEYWMRIFLWKWELLHTLTLVQS